MTDPFAEKTLEESSWIIFKEELEGVSIDVFGPRGRKRRENHFPIPKNCWKSVVKLKGKFPCRVLIDQNTHA